MSATTRKLFVAGSTGATGLVLVPMARRLGLAVVPHVRPKSAAMRAPDVDTAVVDLADTEKLAAAMRGCTTVLQLIGTMRKRFAAGDTYETSDIGTTDQLIAGAKAAGVDHLILLSSVGAGGVGAYLKAKAVAEKLVRDSGIEWTIFRPSALVGGERKPIPGLKVVTRLLGLKQYEPIALEQLAAAMLRCASDRAPLSVAVEGPALWELVGRARPA